jgi:hypothetical protein
MLVPTSSFLAAQRVNGASKCHADGDAYAYTLAYVAHDRTDRDPQADADRNSNAPNHCETGVC